MLRATGMSNVCKVLEIKMGQVAYAFARLVHECVQYYRRVAIEPRPPFSRLHVHRRHKCKCCEMRHFRRSAAVFLIYITLQLRFFFCPPRRRKSLGLKYLQISTLARSKCQMFHVEHCANLQNQVWFLLLREKSRNDPSTLLDNDLGH